MISLHNNIAIGYDDSGRGSPALLFIHGFPHDRTLWAPQLQGLAVQARCLAPDLRGFGETTRTAPYSMDQYADDLVGLLDVQRIDRAIIAGLSMGGYVSFALWRRHPHRVRGLILCNTRPGADTEEGREKRRKLMATARDQGMSAVADAQLPGMLGKTTRENRPEITNSVHRMISSQPVEGVVGALQAMMERPDSTPTLATIDVPTLVVHGDEDAIIPMAEAKSMQAAIRGSTLEVITGAGHLSNLERPAAFNHVVSEFLAKLTLQ
jgi:pimeloyl-ACP methyl ester carboxylesterase